MSPILKNYRADIIKIEHPTRGDDTRAWGPPYAEAKDGISDGQSAYFLSVSLQTSGSLFVPYAIY